MENGVLLDGLKRPDVDQCWQWTSGLRICVVFFFTSANFSFRVFVGYCWWKVSFCWRCERPFTKPERNRTHSRTVKKNGFLCGTNCLGVEKYPFYIVGAHNEKKNFEMKAAEMEVDQHWEVLVSAISHEKVFIISMLWCILSPITFSVCTKFVQFFECCRRSHDWMLEPNLPFFCFRIRYKMYSCRKPLHGSDPYSEK